jgi:hypothetical protein
VAYLGVREKSLIHQVNNLQGNNPPSTLQWNVHQVAHGFVVGNILHNSTGSPEWVKAINSDMDKTADAIVSVVIGVDDFTVQQFGTLTLTTGQWDAVCGTTGGLTQGHYYWVDSTAGKMTPTQPSGTSNFQQVCITAMSATYAEVLLPVDAVVSAGGSTSPLTTKGDIYTYSTVDTRLPIGANNTLLVADSAQTTGNKWATLSAEIDAAIGSTQGDILYRGASVWSVLAPGLNNSYFLATNGAAANPSWLVPSATGGAGWVPAIDIDFSGESNQTIATDGNYTIGGLTWTKANSAQDNVAMAVVNGSGLVIQPSVGGFYAGTTRTVPYIYTDIPTLIPSYYPEMPVRLWVYIAADNIANNGDGVGMGMDNLSTSTNTTMIRIIRRVFNGVTKSIESQAINTGTTMSFSANLSLLDN